MDEADETDFANSTALCQPGDVAISGEYNLTVIDTEFERDILYFGSLGSDPPKNWSTQIISNDPDQFVTTTVNCYDNPPQRPLF